MTLVPFPCPVPPVSHVPTEAAAAERFVRMHGDGLRWDHGRSRWLLFDGHRFRPDANAEVQRLALRFVREWEAEVVDAIDGDRKQQLDFLLKLEKTYGLDGLLNFTKLLEPVADDGQHWDRDPMLLGVRNGVVDLATGRLRAGQPDDRITMSTGVGFDVGERCPRWERFLAEVFCSAPEVVPFLQRAVGYTLSGDTSEQCLFLLHGTGANGKSTLLQTLKFVMGDYALNTPFSTVELHQRASIPNDIAGLVGRRLVMASETQDGARLNESRIKALTGGDSITARFLHSEFFTFEPVAKFWLAVNHLPTVQDDSFGFWRRMRLIPFMERFGIDAGLGAALKDEAPGILAWAVRGCLDWQRDGLPAPAVVVRATNDYESESDVLGPFFAEATEPMAGATVRASALFEHYVAWARRNGLDPLNATKFGKKAKERVRSAKDTYGTFYEGIARR